MPRRITISLTPRQHATVLAALRRFQEVSDRTTMPHFDEHRPLSNDEIDRLCEAIN